MYNLFREKRISLSIRVRKRMDRFYKTKIGSRKSLMNNIISNVLMCAIRSYKYNHAHKLFFFTAIIHLQYAYLVCSDVFREGERVLPSTQGKFF